MRHLFWATLIGWMVLGGFAFAETNAVQTLTLKAAQDLAIHNHPQINAAQLRALAAQQVVAETRSAFFPTATLNVTSVAAGSDNTRILAGGLNNPTVFDRNAE